MDETHYEMDNAGNRRRGEGNDASKQETINKGWIGAPGSARKSEHRHSSKNYKVSKHTGKHTRLSIKPVTYQSHNPEIKEVKSRKCSSAVEKSNANKAEFKEYSQRKSKGSVKKKRKKCILWIDQFVAKHMEK